MRQHLVRLGIVGLVAVTASCGVAVDDGVEVADPDDVPFGLLEPNRVPIAAPGPGPTTAVVLYLTATDHERLVPITRRVDSAGIETIIDELQTGPSATESSLGLQSALSDVDAVTGVEITGTTAIVDLGDSFTELSGADQLTAIAQLIFTLTERPAIEQVAITVEGEPVEVPRGDGTLTRDALDRSDYEPLAPPSSGS